MNNQVGNRDKKIALLLIAAFAWLFISSLIIFHEVHVFGKHIDLASQVFISPKSKDKQGSTVKLLKSTIKIQSGFSYTGILSQHHFTSVIQPQVKQVCPESSSFPTDFNLVTDSPLRAPPVII